MTPRDHLRGRARTPRPCHRWVPRLSPPPSSPLVLALTEPGSHRAGSALHPAPGRRGLLFPRAFISHPEEMRLQPEAPPGFLAAADALGSALGFAFGLQPSLAACTPPPHGHPLIFPFQLLSAILSPCLIALLGLEEQGNLNN